MTQEIKERLEEAAGDYGNYRLSREAADGFEAGAQTILENPSEWGLVDVYKAQQSMCDAGYDIMQLKSQLSKYKEALEHLERFTSDNPDYEFINHRLKEALKQEVNND